MVDGALLDINTVRVSVPRRRVCDVRDSFGSALGDLLANICNRDCIFDKASGDRVQVVTQPRPPTEYTQAT